MYYLRRSDQTHAQISLTSSTLTQEAIEDSDDDEVGASPRSKKIASLKKPTSQNEKPPAKKVKKDAEEVRGKVKATAKEDDIVKKSASDVKGKVVPANELDKPPRKLSHKEDGGVSFLSCINVSDCSIDPKLRKATRNSLS